MAEECVVGEVDVTAKSLLSEKHTIGFNFHDFGRLHHGRGYAISSSPIPCHGHLWSLELFPGGRDNSDEREAHVSIFLILHRIGNDTSDIPVKFSLRVDSAGKERSITKTFANKTDWGFDNYVKRSEVLDGNNHYLVNGTLSVKVDIQVYTNSKVPWIPNKTLHRDMLKMWKSGELADVTFVVGGSKFFAHRCVLMLRSPSLAALTEDYPQDVEIEIDDVDPYVFESLLHFVYSDELPPSVNLKRDARVLLEVADKYECSRLKLLAESELAASGINAENVASLLLFAESKNCPQLKEATLQFFSANPTVVKETEGWTIVKTSPELVLELMDAVIPSSKSPKSNSDETDVDKMSVATLRRKLEARGLQVDGTRQMLVKSLKAALASRGEN